MEEVKRQIPLANLRSVGLSPFQDGIFVINVQNEYSSFLESPLKTEFLTCLTKRYTEQTGKKLEIFFQNHLIVMLKKQRIQIGNPGSRDINFHQANGASTEVTMKPNGKVLNVFVAPGLPNNTRPKYRPASEVRPSNGYKQPSRPIYTAPIPQNQQAQMPPAMVSKQIHPSNGFDPNEILKRNNRIAPNAVHPAPPSIAPRPAPKPKPKGPQVRSLYDYDARDTDELTFQEGQLIDLISEDPSGWWQGKIGTKIGLFPANYVEKV